MPKSRLPRFAPLVIATLVLAATGRAGAEEEAFRIAGRIFVFNYRIAEATALVTLAPVAPMRDGESAVASFEDPAGGAPFEVRQKIWPKLGKVTVESPPLTCILKDRPYRIVVRIEDANGAVRQTLETEVVSDVDQSVLPDAPLVVGPVYTPNPELEGHPDGKLPNRKAPDCPAK